MNRRILLFLPLLLIGLHSFTQPTWKGCEASFTYTQDQGENLIVNFTNTSTGSISEYLWDFGDGSISSGENPSHAFPYMGEFTVCLVISGNDTLNPCLDTICMSIEVDTIPKFNVGGLLFAGSYPINNPVSTGDFAFAYLYRFEKAGLVPVDSVQFDTLGYFWFTGVEEGKYFLKTGLLESSARFSQFLPAYHGDCLLWTDADTLHVDQDIYNVNIYMVRGMPMSEGEGTINGQLFLEESVGGTHPMGKGQVVLADKHGVPYLCTYTDEEGLFHFERIPSGEYMIFCEYTAKYSQKIDLLLDDNNPHADSLELLLYPAISGIDNTSSSKPYSVTVFPNPVRSWLNVQISLKQPEQVRVRVYNQMGQILRTAFWNFPAGNYQQNLNLNSLPPALYLISLEGTRSNWIVSKKFIKK